VHTTQQPNGITRLYWSFKKTQKEGVYVTFLTDSKYVVDTGEQMVRKMGKKTNFKTKKIRLVGKLFLINLHGKHYVSFNMDKVIINHPQKRRMWCLSG